MGDELYCERVKYSAIEHNRITPVRARTRTSQVQRANQSAMSLTTTYNSIQGEILISQSPSMQPRSGDGFPPS